MKANADLRRHGLMWPHHDGADEAGPSEAWVRETLDILHSVLKCGSFNERNFKSEKHRDRCRVVIELVGLAHALLADYPEVLIERRVEHVTKILKSLDTHLGTV